jgi:metal-dependent amidase/aminoacylase/carboxypeptidase family protein
LPIWCSIKPNPLEEAVREKTASIKGKLIAWRRDIHQHLELGDQETRTSDMVADHLRSLGLEVTSTDLIALPRPPAMASRARFSNSGINSFEGTRSNLKG